MRMVGRGIVLTDRSMTRLQPVHTAKTISRVWWAGFGVLLLGGVLTSCAPSEEEPLRPAPQTHTVYMEGMGFRPQEITVNAGDTIVWVNRDLVPHSATSAEAGFDSKVIDAYKSWRVTMERPGAFAYVCTFHPTMTATLHVR
jgi:plastocyanin